MLSTGTTGAISINSKIFFINLNIYIFINIRHNIT